MTDFDEEVRDRSRVARGAKAIKGGSKSRKCTFPSDYLTAAQKRKLNGEVVTISMNKPMNLGQFRMMPTDIQKAYLEGLIDKYNPSYKMIAKMFGCSDATAGSICKTLGVRSSGSTQGVGAEFNERRKRWEMFLNGEDAAQDVPEATEEPVKAQEADDEKAPAEVPATPKRGRPRKPPIAVRSFHTEFTGCVDAEWIFNMVDGVRFPSGVCRVTISVEEIG